VRQQVNEATAWLDASALCGENSQIAKLFRVGKFTPTTTTNLVAVLLQPSWLCCYSQDIQLEFTMMDTVSLKCLVQQGPF